MMARGGGKRRRKGERARGGEKRRRKGERGQGALEEQQFGGCVAWSKILICKCVIT